MNPLEYGLGAVIIAAVTWGGLGHKEASEWQDKYQELQVKYLAEANNYIQCDRVLRETNQQLIDDAIEYEKKLKERKIITIEKVIPKYITLETGDCNETSTVLDFIRTNHP